LNKVQVLYDFAPPGLLDQAAVVPCGTARSSLRLGRMSASTGTDSGSGSETPTTWGALKSSYR